MERDVKIGDIGGVSGPFSGGGGGGGNSSSVSLLSLAVVMDGDAVMARNNAACFSSEASRAFSFFSAMMRAAFDTLTSVTAGT